MLNTNVLETLETIKNVQCPYCGYLLPLIYTKDTTVSGLLVSCKGRQCKRNFVLNIKKGRQQNNVITSNTVYEFKVAFGDDYREHLHDKYGDVIEVIDLTDDNHAMTSRFLRRYETDNVVNTHNIGNKNYSYQRSKFDCDFPYNNLWQ